MGIKYLNKFIQSHCNDSVKQIHLSDLSNKKIVIDTSIYLYRYISDNTLLENFYLMISVFRKYNIIPLFVFDGKPPQEKKDLLKKRKQNKQLAKETYDNLKETLDDVMDDSDKTDILIRMDCLKKEFVKIHHTDISNVKLLLQSYGVSYVDAPGEADKLCAKLVCKNKAYACLSEDMDLFVYGCTRVLRYLSLFKTQAVMYDMIGILNELQLSLDEFKQICIVSGTDYNIDNDNTNLYQSLKYFKQFKKYINTTIKVVKDNTFFDWLENNTNYITNICDLYNISMLFDLKMMNDYNKYENIKIINGPINISNLKQIMELENFIFIDDV